MAILCIAERLNFLNREVTNPCVCTTGMMIKVTTGNLFVFILKRGITDPCICSTSTTFDLPLVSCFDIFLFLMCTGSPILLTLPLASCTLLPPMTFFHFFILIWFYFYFYFILFLFYIFILFYFIFICIVFYFILLFYLYFHYQ